MPDAFTYKIERPWPNRRLKIAAIVGHTTPQTSRIWVRAGSPRKYHVLYFDPERENALGWFNKYKEQIDLDKTTIDASKEAGVSIKDADQVDWDSNTTFVVDIDDLKEPRPLMIFRRL